MADPTEKEVTPQAPAPTEQPVHPLDAAFAAEEAEITKLLEHPTEDTGTETPAQTPPAAPAKEEPPPAGEPPAKQPPKVEPPAEQPPVEAKPEEKKERKGPTWKQVRDMQRQLKEEQRKREEAERRAASQPPAQPPAAPDEEAEIKDPLTIVSEEVKEVKQANEQTRAELQRVRVAEQNRILMEEIRREEDAYSKDHPDYRESMEHLAAKRLEHYDRTGRIDRAADWEMTNHPEIVERFATETGRDPSDDDQLYEAARDMVGRILINQERIAIIEDCRATGKSIPDVVYGLAQDFGWKSKGKETQDQPPPKTPAQERVERAKEQEPVATSLSAMQPGGVPQPRKITTRQQLLDMDPTEAERYIMERDRENPFWDKDLV